MVTVSRYYNEKRGELFFCGWGFMKFIMSVLEYKMTVTVFDC